MPSGGLVAMGNVRALARDLGAGLAGLFARQIAFLACRARAVRSRDRGRRRVRLRAGTPRARAAGLCRNRQERLRRPLRARRTAHPAQRRARLRARRRDGERAARARRCGRGARQRHRGPAGHGGAGRLARAAALGHPTGVARARLRRCAAHRRGRRRAARPRRRARRGALGRAEPRGARASRRRSSWASCARGWARSAPCCTRRPSRSARAARRTRPRRRRGVPVVALELDDAPRDAWYRKRQVGLLGEALAIVPGEPDAPPTPIAALLGDDRAARALMSAVGRERMGGPGGARAIARAVVGLAGAA